MSYDRRSTTPKHRGVRSRRPLANQKHDDVRRQAIFETFKMLLKEATEPKPLRLAGDDSMKPRRPDYDPDRHGEQAELTGTVLRPFAQIGIACVDVPKGAWHVLPQLNARPTVAFSSFTRCRARVIPRFPPRNRSSDRF